MTPVRSRKNTSRERAIFGAMESTTSIVRRTDEC